MPKSSRKARPEKDRQTSQQSTQIDFTLSDYADAPQTSAGKQNRMKKGAKNAWKVNVKGMEGSTQNKDDLAWDEKDLSDFEVQSENETESEDKDQEEEGAIGGCSGPPKAKVKKNVKRFEGGVVYPIDVWFLIGDWIKPESVSVFSAICKHSHDIIHTARFWNTLYRRYTAEEVTLPKQLQPRFMAKIHGLRTRVVKTLFIVYSPFVQRIKTTVPFEQQLDTLEGHMCQLMWYKRVKNAWHFFFKFKKRGRTPCSHTLPDRSQHLWNFEPDVCNNDEEDNKVLQVVTTNYIALPVIMGHTLQRASISVGHAMRYYKLRLISTQQNGKVMDRHSLESGTVMLIDPVVNVRVLRWWEPEYPGNGDEPLSALSSPS